MTSRHGASWGSGGPGFKSPLPDQTEPLPPFLSRSFDQRRTMTAVKCGCEVSANVRELDRNGGEAQDGGGPVKRRNQ